MCASLLAKSYHDTNVHYADTSYFPKRLSFLITYAQTHFTKMVVASFVFSQLKLIMTCAICNCQTYYLVVGNKDALLHFIYHYDSNTLHVLNLKGQDRSNTFSELNTHLH